MLEKLQITNYRSIANATVELRPFTLLVGANGSGKSNLLRLLQELSAVTPGHGFALTKHFNHPRQRSQIEITAGHKVHTLISEGGDEVPPRCARQSCAAFASSRSIPFGSAALSL